MMAEVAARVPPAAAAAPAKHAQTVAELMKPVVGVFAPETTAAEAVKTLR